MATTTTNASGYYEFPGLSDGNYGVTPTKDGLEFTPTSTNIAVSGGNETADFVGAEPDVWADGELGGWFTLKWDDATLAVSQPASALIAHPSGRVVDASVAPDIDIRTIGQIGGYNVWYAGAAGATKGLIGTPGQHYIIHIGLPGVVDVSEWASNGWIFMFEAYQAVISDATCMISPYLASVGYNTGTAGYYRFERYQSNFDGNGKLAYRTRLQGGAYDQYAKSADVGMYSDEIIRYVHKMQWELDFANKRSRLVTTRMGSTVHDFGWLALGSTRDFADFDRVVLQASHQLGDNCPFLSHSAWAKSSVVSGAWPVWP